MKYVIVGNKLYKHIRSKRERVKCCVTRSLCYQLAYKFGDIESKVKFVVLHVRRLYMNMLQVVFHSGCKDLIGEVCHHK